jgi:hypothetical protein
MNDMTPTSAERAAKLEGMGCKRKRVEDIRFVQGKACSMAIWFAHHTATRA